MPVGAHADQLFEKKTRVHHTTWRRGDCGTNVRGRAGGHFTPWGAADPTDEIGQESTSTP